MRVLDTRKRRGFTLIELMIVVAIIGVLAATAISRFLQFQLRSKTSEAKTNLAALRTAEEGYFAEFGIYIPSPAPAPALPAVAAKRPWPAVAPGFDTVGWSPEGDVYFVYHVLVVGTAYTAAAQGQLDGGGPTADYGYVQPDPAGALAGDPLGGGCLAGVYNPLAPAVPLANSVGPCTALDGTTDF